MKSAVFLLEVFYRIRLPWIEPAEDGEKQKLQRFRRHGQKHIFSTFYASTNRGRRCSNGTLLYDFFLVCILGQDSIDNLGETGKTELKAPGKFLQNYRHARIYLRQPLENATFVARAPRQSAKEIHKSEVCYLQSVLVSSQTLERQGHRGVTAIEDLAISKSIQTWKDGMKMAARPRRIE